MCVCVCVCAQTCARTHVCEEESIQLSRVDLCRLVFEPYRNKEKNKTLLTHTLFCQTHLGNVCCVPTTFRE